MKRALVSLAALLALLLLVVIVRTARFGAAVDAASTPPIAAGAGWDAAISGDAPARLAAAVRIPTVSYFDSTTRLAAFRELHGLLAASFPRTHAALTREVFDSAGLLFTWPGTDTTLAPVILMGHQDVVPVEPGTESKWTHPPFGGVVAGGFVWGRGTLDDKVSVLATLEAVESLVAQGFAPRRTVLLVFGHQEEKGGRAMPALVEMLRARGVRPSFVMDEGGSLTEGLVPGLDGVVALVGTAEKGYLSLRLTARGAEGHSSMPPRETSVGILARAITRLEEAPLPARLDGATRGMLETLGPAMPVAQRAAIANLWLTRPLLVSTLAGTPSGNASVRTTIAPTMLQGSAKDNVMPGTATAVVNFRILPGDRVADVVRHVREAVDDERVAVEALPGLAVEPSPTSPVDHDGYRAIRDAIRETWPGARVAPYLVVGATDSRHFAALTPNVYRFAPLRLGPADLSRIHGTNERIGVADYVQGVRFLRRLIVRAAS